MDADGCKIDGRRLVLSYSPKLASKQRRAKMIDKLQKKLGKSGKGVGNLISNSKYRKWINVDDAKVADIDIEAIEAQVKAGWCAWDLHFIGYRDLVRLRHVMRSYGE